MRIANLCILSSALLVYSSADAAITTYEIDLAGVYDTADNIPNSEWRVFGTITLDPTLPIDASIQNWDLRYWNLHFMIGPQSFTELRIQADSQDLEWNDANGELYINRVRPLTITGPALQWVKPGPNGEFAFRLGAGSTDHEVGDSFTVQNGTTLKPRSGPDGPTGFLLGTAVVPEPISSHACLAMGTVALARRKRRAVNQS